MTLQQLFDSASHHPDLLVGFFAMLPITAAIAGIGAGDEGAESPWKYLYSTLVYGAAVPGMFAVVLGLYMIMVEHRSIMQFNVLIFILPFLSMVATLLLINRKVALRHVPGFSKLSGLLMMVAATFVVMLVMQKMRIFVVFFGSMKTLVGLFIVLLALFMFGYGKMFGGEKNQSRPSRKY